MMRQTRWATRLVALLVVGGSAQMLGCFPFDFSEEATGTGGSGGTGGYDPPACPGDPVADPALVRDDCGTFVSASAPLGGNGTKASPFSSLSEAAAQRAKRIYACAEDYAATETLRFTDGVEIYAGFTDCGAAGTWTWAESSRATLRGPADEVALTLDQGANLLRNIDVIAADAITDGGSSIALVLTGGTLTAEGVDLRAGAAMAGADGATLMADTTLDGLPGINGTAACMGDLVNGNLGGAAVSKMCPGDPAETSIGGKGGDGGTYQTNPVTVLPGGNGDPGEPDLGPGGAGTGEPATGNTWNCGVGANLGGANAGASGTEGESGAGAPESDFGALSATGFIGASGQPGLRGTVGQGGGGGGGARGGLICQGGTTYGLGASAGSGGSGGCGGAGGNLGQGGGASIALVSLDAESVTLTNVRLVAGDGGAGGRGGNGQPGGNGGSPGQGGLGAGGSKAGCSGGFGGAGGNGGVGGGGRGGHSIGIVFTGAAPTGGEITVGMAGLGGDAGPNHPSPATGAGADGVAADCWDFAANTACGG